MWPHIGNLPAEMEGKVLVFPQLKLQCVWVVENGCRELLELEASCLNPTAPDEWMKQCSTGDLWQDILHRWGVGVNALVGSARISSVRVNMANALQTCFKITHLTNLIALRKHIHKCHPTSLMPNLKYPSQTGSKAGRDLPLQQMASAV